MHPFADVHATPSRALLSAPEGSGVGSIDQRVPSKCSASGPSVPSDLVKVPTAVHQARETHVTASRLLVGAFGGFAVRWIDQCVPSKRSASVLVVPSMVVKNPTAVQELTDGHDTPSSAL
jgi:hypothetical protein